MYKIVILCSLGVSLFHFTFARVVRDLSLGYHYHPDHGSDGSSVLQAPAVIPNLYSYTPLTFDSSYLNAAQSFRTTGTSGFVPSTQTYLSSHGNDLNSGIGFDSGLSFIAGGSNTQSFTSSSSSTQNNYNGQAHHTHINQAPTVSKHFYIHSAPEDHDEQQIVRYINIGHPHKNYNVVFIKAPTSSVSKAKIIANVAPVEDKTAIYVLAKKSNALDVSAEVITPPSVHSKPEVFFVKYKTPAEAEHAQHVIQTQYDALGGTSQVSNEGVISVSSVIGSLGASESIDNAETLASSHDSINSGSIGVGSSGDTGQGVNVVSTGDNTANTYLPAYHG